MCKAAAAAARKTLRAIRGKVGLCVPIFSSSKATYLPPALAPSPSPPMLVHIDSAAREYVHVAGEVLDWKSPPRTCACCDVSVCAKHSGHAEVSKKDKKTKTKTKKGEN